MQRADVIHKIEEILEEDSGTFQGDEDLEQIGWDSVSFMAFIAFADSELGLSLAPKKLAACKSLNDVLNLTFEAQSDSSPNE